MNISLTGKYPRVSPSKRGRDRPQKATKMPLRFPKRAVLAACLPLASCGLLPTRDIPASERYNPVDKVLAPLDLSLKTDIADQPWGVIILFPILTGLWPFVELGELAFAQSIFTPPFDGGNWKMVGGPNSLGYFGTRLYDANIPGEHEKALERARR